MTVLIVTYKSVNRARRFDSYWKFYDPLPSSEFAIFLLHFNEGIRKNKENLSFIFHHHPERTKEGLRTNKKLYP